MNEQTLFWTLAGLFFLLLAAVLLLRKRSGLPGGEVIYDDLSHEGSPAEVLSSSTYGIAGKPDMILRQGRTLIPVEIKSARGGERPYPSHVMQLAAYCLLIEEHYGIRPPYGILRYRDKQFEIPFTDRLTDELRMTLEKMRTEAPEKSLPAGCHGSRKCDRCGYAAYCQRP